MKKTATSARMPAALRDFAEEVLAGLSRTPKALPCRFFYDARGSELFEQITWLPEYYLTRTEIALLEAHGAEIAAMAGPDACLIEFGSGSSRKTDLLIEAMPGLAAYVPIDISHAALAGAAARLSKRFPDLRIVPVHADFASLAALPATVGAGRRLGFFPGSTIGNFERDEATRFLRRTARLLGPDSVLIVGADLDKSPDVLLPAYDDASGVTAAFNLNLLARINRELDADFDLGRFAHEAIYNPQQSRIEIYLRSREAQTVTVAGKTFCFGEGERIHTENSHKYSVQGFAALAAEAGWTSRAAWTDGGGLFCIHALTL
jgi:dimethylhistidine N-methyltransferase